MAQALPAIKFSVGYEDFSEQKKQTQNVTEIKLSARITPVFIKLSSGTLFFGSHVDFLDKSLAKKV